MVKKVISGLFILLLIMVLQSSGQQATQWKKYEIRFQSEKTYNNPLYEVNDFGAVFTAPSGRTLRVPGFWDGDKVWKIRFMPDETGVWKWESYCSDKKNTALDLKSGTFTCGKNSQPDDIYQRGAVIAPAGKYHLTYTDGTPFFWLACTAWNGALKSTPEEWTTYLEHRKKNHYNVIQLVTTQWRGCDANAEGEVAFTGSGQISVNPEFFRRIDERIDKVNEYGLVASPVLLWALPSGAGRHLSPGYHLPIDEAVLLARYIVARYQGNQVIWELGGDGKYFDELESRWKTIGRRVFNNIHHAPATLHPHGRSFVGDLYAAESWYGFMGYQSSHSAAEGTVNWINKGPMAQQWSKLRPMPYINMEPNYEEIHFTITDKDVRNASYWSLFATPVAGVTYGANGIWPWLRDGESILNHRDAPGTSTWRKSIDFPGSLQMGYLARFFKQFEWWKLYPANELLAGQPGEKQFNHWVSVLKHEDHSLILVYFPVKAEIVLFNPHKHSYTASWFNPITGKEDPCSGFGGEEQIRVKQEAEGDRILVLKRKM